MSQLQARREFVAFSRQKSCSKTRGIGFEFSFEEWRSWWLEKLGPDWMALRGRTKGKYQMGRIGDVGAYNAKNCICITISKNSADGARQNVGRKNGASKLTPEQVSEARKLYLPGSKEFGVNALARRYGVRHGTLGPLLRGTTWRDPLLGWVGGEPKRERAA